jgi:hypothetical protein
MNGGPRSRWETEPKISVTFCATHNGVAEDSNTFVEPGIPYSWLYRFYLRLLEDYWSIICYHTARPVS